MPCDSHPSQTTGVVTRPKKSDAHMKLSVEPRLSEQFWIRTSNLLRNVPCPSPYGGVEDGGKILSQERTFRRRSL